MSDQSALSSRAIMGRYYALMEQSTGVGWVDGVSNLFGSDQASETYEFLGMSPAMREWVGSRQAKSLRGNEITLINKHYEATLEIRKRDLRRDKTGQINARMGEFISRAQSHWASLLSTLLINAESTVCYDGQYFFDTDHSEGDSGTQSNDITVDISAMPAALHGSTTAPSVEEMQHVITQAITKILGFVDDRGEPMNEGASDFLVKVPMSLYNVAALAVSFQATNALQENFNPNLVSGIRVRVEPNARLTWTDKVAVFRTDSPIKAFIRQTEQEVETKVLAEGSDYWFHNDAMQIGIDSWRTVGYGYWQRACLAQMI